MHVNKVESQVMPDTVPNSPARKLKKTTDKPVIKVQVYPDVMSNSESAVDASGVEEDVAVKSIDAKLLDKGCLRVCNPPVPEST